MTHFLNEKVLEETQNLLFNLLRVINSSAIVLNNRDDLVPSLTAFNRSEEKFLVLISH